MADTPLEGDIQRRKELLDLAEMVGGEQNLSEAHKRELAEIRGKIKGEENKANALETPASKPVEGEAEARIPLAPEQLFESSVLDQNVPAPQLAQGKFDPLPVLPPPVLPILPTPPTDPYTGLDNLDQVGMSDMGDMTRGSSPWETGMAKIAKGGAYLKENRGKKLSDSPLNDIIDDAGNIMTEAAGAMAGNPMDIAKLGFRAAKFAAKLIDHALEAMENIGLAGANALMATSPTGLAKAGIEGIRGITEMVDPLGIGSKEVKQVLGFGEALMDAVEKLHSWTDSLNNINMELSKFSAAMAGVSAQSLVRNIQLERERGDRRAEAAKELSEFRDRRVREEALWEDAWNRHVQSPITAGLEGLWTAILQGMRHGQETTPQLNAPGDPNAPATDLTEWMGNVGDRHWAESYGVRARPEQQWRAF